MENIKWPTVIFYLLLLSIACAPVWSGVVVLLLLPYPDERSMAQSQCTMNENSNLP